MPANETGVWGGPQPGPGAPREGVRRATPLALFFSRALLGLAAVVLLAVLAAWQITPRLDWARYRQGISAFAAGRLGRQVSIGGPIHLALLPHPELTAQDVTLADRGDGISARIGALRLTVAIGPLLRGRLVPLSLGLDDPVITAPWPLPGGATGRVPTVAQGFGAHLDGGTLRLGGLTITAIDADIRADPDTGAFAATGTEVGGATVPVRFSSFIGAPGADGAAVLSLTLDGLNRLVGTSAVFHGRRAADGVVAGSVRANGPNASLLLPGPPEPWSVQGPMQATPGMLRAASLQVSLGTSQGAATVAWGLAPGAVLDVQARVGQIAIGSWAAAAANGTATLPMHLDLAADAASLLGGTVRMPHVSLFLTPERTEVRSAEATLPGGASLHVSGALRPAQRHAQWIGAFHVMLPDAAATLAWLRPALPPTITALPPSMLHQADLNGDFVAAAAGFSLKTLRATLDGVQVEGEVGFTQAKLPVLRATLSVDQINAAAWLRALPARPDSLAAAFGQFDATLDLKAAHATLPGLALTQFALELAGSPDSLAVTHLSADLPGGHLNGAGKVAQNGTIADAWLNLDANDAAMLPAAWRVLPGLWHGPLHLALNAAGPVKNIALQARCDVDDLRAEMEAAVSVPETTLTGTVTLRHPGAPRLLRDAGIDDAARWLEQGSVAVIVHFAAAPRHVDVRDFSVAAANLRLGGKASLDFSGPLPALQASVDAPALTLPSLDPRAGAILPFDLLSGWQGDVRVVAAQVFSDLRPIASGLDAGFILSGGVLSADIRANAATGNVQFGAALDPTAPMLAVQGNIEGAALAEMAEAPPWDWSAGTVDAAVDATAGGYSAAAMLATMRGTVDGSLHGAVLQGVDLPGVTALLGARPPKLRAALLTSMARGDTGKLSGNFTGVIDHGAVSLAAHDMRGDGGDVDLEATLDLPARTEDAAVHLRPAVTAPPTLGVRLVGPWATPRRIIDVQDGLAWAGIGKKMRTSRPLHP